MTTFEVWPIGHVRGAYLRGFAPRRPTTEPAWATELMATYW